MTLEKFPDLYAPTLLHFIVGEIEKTQPNLLTFPDTWTALWAASDISLKQVNPLSMIHSSFIS
jgi:hypothetical protein